MQLSFALLAVCAVIAIAVLAVALPRIGLPGPMTLFLRLAAVAGIAAVGSSVMYLIFVSSGSMLALVAGDTAMVLAPALLFVALATFQGRRPRVPAAFVVAATALVAIVTAVVPQPESLAVKALVLAAAGVLCADAAVRARSVRVRPMVAIAVTTGCYAAYSIARVIVGAVWGWESGAYVSAFSFAPTTVVSGLAVVVIGIAVLRLRIDAPAQPKTSAAGVVTTTIVVGDWSLASAAYGLDVVHALVEGLRTAGRELDPAAVDARRGVTVGIPDALAAVSERVRTVGGWSDDEVALLSDADTLTAPVPVPRRRGRIGPGGRGSRT